MMKKSITIVSGFVLFCCIACNPAIQPKDEIEKANRTIEPSLAVYTDTLAKLPKDAPGTIEHALRLYETIAPHDSTGADSAASALALFINDIIRKENERLLKDSSDFSVLLDPVNNTLTDQQKTMKSNLHTNRLKLVSDGEGSVYIVPMYETILASIKPKTSAPVDAYFDLQAKEDTSPVFLDAGLAIELPELVDRLVISEGLMNQKLPKQFLTEVTRLNGYYTNALVAGADNSPSIAYETKTLSEEFKKGYDYLLAKYPSTKAAAKINVWLAVAASGDQRKIDDYRRTMQ